MLQPGQTAPAFVLPDADMQTVSLSAFKGRKHVVLYFYPRDGTPGCILEAAEFSDHEEQFVKHDCVILGISRDDCLSHAAFSTAGSLYRSDDVAQTWRRIDHGVTAESTVMAVCVHPGDPARVYCVTRSGQVIGTEDSGASWTDYRLPKGVHDVYTVACI